MFGGWARGGIGRREGLRILWSNPCRFDPCRAHQHLTKAVWTSPAPEPEKLNLSLQCRVQPHPPVTVGAVPGVLNRQFQVRDLADVELKPLHVVVCDSFRTKQLTPVPANHEDYRTGMTILQSVLGGQTLPLLTHRNAITLNSAVGG